MREILFKGFHKEENGKETIYIDGQAIRGKWVFGDLTQNPRERCSPIITEYKKLSDTLWEEKPYIVIPETIGQYTGLDDKNGKKIFENDYLKFKVFSKDSEGYVDCYLGQFYIVDCGGYSDYNFLVYTDMEVIGTKFDKEDDINIQDLNMHCDNCPDEIFSLCNKFCAYEDEKTALCCQPRFENMKVREVEKIELILKGKEVK